MLDEVVAASACFTGVVIADIVGDWNKDDADAVGVCVMTGAITAEIADVVWEQQASFEAWQKFAEFVWFANPHVNSEATCLMQFWTALADPMLANTIMSW